jgi:hypothetical protein
MIASAMRQSTGRGHVVREFAEEASVLSRWLGRDVAEGLGGVIPVWTAFRFRDAAVFEPDGSEGRMYLVRGETVREFAVSETSIDAAYAQLTEVHALPDVA